MAERVKPYSQSFRLINAQEGPEFRIVSRHPAITVIAKDGGFLGGGVPRSGSRAKELNFYDRKVSFDDDDLWPGDSIQFYFAEELRGEGRVEDLHLVVRTQQRQWPRLTLSFEVDQIIDQRSPAEVLYNGLAYWRKIEPEDPSIKIASREKGESHILKNDPGYLCPPQVMIRLEESGDLLLIPVIARR